MIMCDEDDDDDGDYIKKDKVSAYCRMANFPV